MKPEPTERNQIRLIGLGEWSSREHRLQSSDISVGSARENDLAIDHPTVSRKHAILRHQNGRYSVTDLDSSNGTFVNGQRIKRPVLIQPGDEISFGAAKFAMLGAAVPPPHRRPSAWRMIGALVGLVVFAAAGFLFTRYAVHLGRIESPAPAPTAIPQPRLHKPVAVREVPESMQPTAAATSEASEANTFSPLWLKQVNDFRASVNLAPIESDSRLTDGDRRHATYLLKNFATEIHEGTLGVEVHSEDPTNPWYTAEGSEAARNSDIAEQAAVTGVKLPDPQGWAIDGWMVAPFHRLPILSPLLREAGFAFECESGMCVALLNVHSGAVPSPRLGTTLEHPILFPPDGGSVVSGMRKLENETPNPISGCDGYVFPTGLPITVQLGPMVDAQLNSFSLTDEDGAEVEACGIDAISYYNPDEGQRTGVISILRSQGAIVIVPRHPLEAGARYDVLATVNGRDYKWSFEIAR